MSSNLTEQAQICEGHLMVGYTAKKCSSTSEDIRGVNGKWRRHGPGYSIRELVLS